MCDRARAREQLTALCRDVGLLDGAGWRGWAVRDALADLLATDLTQRQIDDVAGLLFAALASVANTPPVKPLGVRLDAIRACVVGAPLDDTDRWGVTP